MNTLDYGADQRFRTAPPATPILHGRMIDSYTGLAWCGHGLHLLTPENQRTNGQCLPCSNRTTRNRRRLASSSAG
jgi:hypothetical protein